MTQLGVRGGGGAGVPELKTGEQDLKEELESGRSKIMTNFSRGGALRRMIQKPPIYPTEY